MSKRQEEAEALINDLADALDAERIASDAAQAEYAMTIADPVRRDMPIGDFAQSKLQLERKRTRDIRRDVEKKIRRFAREAETLPIDL